MLHDAGEHASCSAAYCFWRAGSVQTCLALFGAVERIPVLQSLETFNTTLQTEFVKALQLSTLANVAAHINNISAGEHQESESDPRKAHCRIVCESCLQAGKTCIHEAAASSFCNGKRQMCAGLPCSGPVSLRWQAAEPDGDCLLEQTVC